MVQDGEIGQVQSFQGGFFNQQQAGAWCLSRRLGGGGSVLDLGIYPLNSIRWITGEEPTEFGAIVSTLDQSGRFAEVEQSIGMDGETSLRNYCVLCIFLWPNRARFLNINGDKGYLQMQPGFFYKRTSLDRNQWRQNSRHKQSRRKSLSVRS